MNEASESCEFYAPIENLTIKRSKSSKKNKIYRVENVPDSSSNDTWERQELFHEQWAKIEEKLMSLTSDIFQQYVDKLYDFILKYSYIADKHVMSPGDGQLCLNHGLLPTAMIALNSKSTQVRIVDELSQRIEEDSNKIQTIQLNAHNLANISNLFQTFFNSLLNDKICTKNNIDKSRWKSIPFDKILSLWLNSFDRKTNESPTNLKVSLVIFVYDFENVNKQTLLNLILILKEYLKDISILFVFFIYNQLNNSIQYFLPAQATDYLMIEDIPSFYEHKFVYQLLKEFIRDSDIQFKIHPNMIKQIHFYFTNYEFSFSNFIFILRSLCFDHFYNNPLSVICSDVKSLKKELQSNERLLNVVKNSLAVPIDTNEVDYIDSIISQYEDLLRRHKEFTFYLVMLVDLQTFARCGTKCFLSLYCDIITIRNYSFKDGFLGALFNLDENCWNEACRKIISKYEKHTKNALLNCFVSFHEKLTEILNKEHEEEEEQLNSAKKLGLECEMNVKVKVVKNKLRNLHSRSEWKQSMKQWLKNDSKELTPFESWKKELIHSIDCILKNSSLSLHDKLIESLFYSNFEFIRKHHFISTRDELELDLDLSSCSQSLSNIYPNSFILYELYKQASPIVNLHQWFVQFCEEKSLYRKDFTQKELIVHFSTTLSDFDYIGLVQSSRYKADYLNKLVWL